MALLKLSKMPRTHWDGECPFCDQLTLLGGPTIVGECGGWWRTGYVSSQSSLLFPVFLALPGCMGPSRRVCHLTVLPSPPLLTVMTTTRLCCLKLPSHLHPALPQWGGEDGRCLFQEGNCFWPSYTSGHSVRATAQLSTAAILAGTQLRLWPPPLSMPSSSLPYLFQYSHLQMSPCVDLLGMLCVEQRILG